MRANALALLLLVQLLLVSTAAAQCGDGICDETCYTCEQDCGPCQPRGIVRTCVQPHTFALTFDDGPAGPTSRLLDILDAEGVKATFFVIGMQVYNVGMSQVVRRAQESGHFIASHSFTHPYLTQMPLAQVRRELNDAAAAIRSATCINTKVLRPPYGATDANVERFIQDMGYRIVNWNLDTWDWNSDGNTIYQNVVNGLQQLNPNSIVHLAHDRIAHSVEQVPRIISAIRGYGYRFVTIDECLYGSGGSSSLTWQMRDCQPQPPPGAVCGDHQCSAGESCINCVADCGQCQFECGDGRCDSHLGETGNVCPADCESSGGGGGTGPVSSNGRCGSDHGNTVCPAGQCCSQWGWCGTGNDHCEGGTGGGTPEPDKTGFCGDGSCQTHETCAWCPYDCQCGDVCGDLQCGATESCSSCPYDCGTCAPPPAVPVCGDSICNGAETCSTCAADCGPCQTPGAATKCLNPNHFALTFDDGPTAVTSALLDILKAKEVRATFFVVGSQVVAPGMPQVVRRAVQEGHWLGSHSNSQATFPSMTLDAIRAELAEADAAFQSETCFKPRFLRPQHGSVTPAIQTFLDSLGYKTVLWNLDTQDFAGASASSILARVSAALGSPDPSGGFIHLQHDRELTSVGTVGAIIDMVRQAGYELVTIDECLYGSGANAARDFQVSDCSAFCGDGVCAGASAGETASSCPTDCSSNPGGYCGDGICGSSESCSDCCEDCGVCVPEPEPSGGSPSLAGECGSQHGDTVCPTGECCSQWGWCGTGTSYCNANSQQPPSGGGGGDGGGEPEVCVPQDRCGDGACGTLAGEDCTSCPTDCGVCEPPPGPVCGDSVCQPAAGETCSSCATDCGACTGGGGGGGGGSTNCHGCWFGTSGPCQGVSTVCYSYFPDTSMCPAGTSACTSVSALQASEVAAANFVLITVDVSAPDVNLTRWMWNDATTSVVKGIIVHTIQVPESRVRLVSIEERSPARRLQAPHPADAPANDGASSLLVSVMVTLADASGDRLSVDDITVARTVEAALASTVLVEQLSTALGHNVATAPGKATLESPAPGATNVEGGTAAADAARGTGPTSGDATPSDSSGLNGVATTAILFAGVAVALAAAVGVAVWHRRRTRSRSRSSSRGSTSRRKPRDSYAHGADDESDSDEDAAVHSSSAAESQRLTHSGRGHARGFAPLSTRSDSDLHNIALS